MLSVTQDYRAKNNSMIKGNKFETIRKETIMDPCNLLKYSTYKNMYTCFNIAHRVYFLV